MRRFASAALLLLCACDPLAGDPVQDRAEWYARVAELDLKQCADTPATYNLLDLDTWGRRGYLFEWGGFVTDADEVYVRTDYSGAGVSFLLQHEFTHVLLRCAGVPEAVHRAHEGPAWDGLRAGDPG